MKIDEFIEKVNEHDGMRAKHTDAGIAVGTPNNKWIFNIPEDATNFIEIDTWATSNSLYWKKPDREYLSALIEELLHTPIKERFQKYVLSAMRYVAGSIAIKQYVDAMNVSTNNVEFHFGYADDKDNAMQFTQQGLGDLSQYFPKEAIEAMKEPVDGDKI